MSKIAIIGGGAAGFFCAIHLAESRPDLQIDILEKSNSVLGKVKVSGGGRCNVTHSCFEPKELIKNYPRGQKELLGPFFNFQPSDTVEWFEQRGVELKTEEDGRMFPVSDSSQTIIDCFQQAASNAGVNISMKTGVKRLTRVNDKWSVETSDDSLDYDYVVCCAGSSPAIWSLFQSLGHSIITPVPSLFTFNIHDNDLQKLAGLSIEHVSVKIKGTKMSTSGALLVTHWGLSAPAILKLSALAARHLHELDYNFSISIDVLPHKHRELLDGELRATQDSSIKNIYNYNPFDLPKRFWSFLLAKADVPEDRKWSELRKDERLQLIGLLKELSFEVNGKSTFKEEFVTSGGVNLKEVNFKTMESKVLEGVYFAGEVLDIDAYTGGFNFQAAWTTAYLAAQAISESH